MIRIGSIVLRVDDLQRQTEFWEAALGYVRRDSGESDDFVLLGPPDGAPEVWSVYGAERSQPVATGGRWDDLESGSDTRKPLPWVATSCPDPKMVRKGSPVRVREWASSEGPAGGVSSSLGGPRRPEVGGEEPEGNPAAVAGNRRAVTGRLVSCMGTSSQRLAPAFARRQRLPRLPEMQGQRRSGRERIIRLGLQAARGALPARCFACCPSGLDGTAKTPMCP
jgi:catechol 2,3-dioxygenase-like lactoylglutathione lyase family enzyme